jgi:glutathione S-transferase
MSSILAMPLAAIVTILASVVYLMTGFGVASMRGKHKIDAPAVTGNPEFERAYRVQMNTLEAMPIFLPALWLATIYFSPRVEIVWWLPAVLGVLWIIGRYLYMRGYMVEASKRSTGFLVSLLAQITLMLLTLVGVAMSWPTMTTSV